MINLGIESVNFYFPGTVFLLGLYPGIWFNKTNGVSQNPVGFGITAKTLQGKEMSTIINEPKIKMPLIRAIRELLEHRALWLYLLCDEARKKGFAPEQFAPEAIRRCGCYQGKGYLQKGGSSSLKSLKEQLFSLPARLIFEMKIRSCTDDTLDIDFYYCPLVASWQKQGCSDEEIVRLCDFAMEGDRGIAESFGCKLDLRKTIAQGQGLCEIRFRRKSA
jgi:hypothetical protein